MWVSSAISDYSSLRLRRLHGLANRETGAETRLRDRGRVVTEATQKHAITDITLFATVTVLALQGEMLNMMIASV